MHYKLEEIAEIVKGEIVYGSKNVIINKVSIDSRTISLSEQTLFFALRGKQHDGHDFISELIHGKKAHYYVVDKDFDTTSFDAKNTFIQVENTLQALQDLAAFHRRKFHVPVVGVTGSNGKTIVKEWLFQLLWDTKKIVRSPRSFNSQVGVPLSILEMDNEDELAIFEAGISEPGEMQRLEKMVAPTIGIFTNIGLAHSQGFRTQEEKIREKLKLFSHSKTIVYCKDYKEIDVEIQSLKLPSFTWSYEDGTADLFVKTKTFTPENYTQLVVYGLKSNIELTIPFVDPISIENAVHCLSVILVLDLYNSKIQLNFPKLEAVEMRLEVKSATHQSILINDTYNSDILSLSIALDHLDRINQAGNEKVLILSDIYESGKSQQNIYKMLNELVRSHPIDKLFLVGKNGVSYEQLITACADKVSFEKTDGLIEYLKSAPIKNSSILIKGSRKFEFEKITSFLEVKSHKTRLEINLRAIEHNYNFYKSLIKPSTKKMAMLKAFAYGAGYYEIAKTLAFSNIDYFGVAYADEAIFLRNKGIQTPIMVMLPEPDQFQLYEDYKIEPVIYSRPILDELISFSEKNPKSDLKIHLELDTGMHRLGFVAEELEDLCHVLGTKFKFKVQSVFSHLVSGENKDFDSFTLGQITDFKQMCEKLEERLNYKFIKHILNSSGIERFPDAQMDMVRLGIGLYGVSANEHILSKLTLAGSLKTHVAQVKKVKKGMSVGYGRAFMVNKESDIAIIPIGYADGIPRALGNGKGTVMVNGKEVPFVGNICMDMCMIDVSGLNVEIGQEITIYNNNHKLFKWAKVLNTIPYELLTSVSERVKRIYFFE